MAALLEERGVVLVLAVKSEVALVVCLVGLEAVSPPVAGLGPTDNGTRRNSRDSGEEGEECLGVHR